MNAIQRPVCVYRDKSRTTGEITKAMADASLEFLPINFDSIGRDEDGREYRYASLTAINKATKAALCKHGCWLHTDYGVDENGLYAVAVVDHVSGEYVSSLLPIPAYQSIHKKKAAMTLMRRTAIEGLLNISTESDTDGPPMEPEAQAEDKTAAWEEQKRLAKDAIVAAANRPKVDSIVAKVRAKVDGGDMNPADLEELVTLAEKRIKAIEAAAAKAGVKPEPVGGAK